MYYAISPIEKRKQVETYTIEEEGIKILKLQIGNVQKINPLERWISTLRLESIVLGGIKRYFNDIKFDLVIYPTPPITFEKVIRYVKKRDNAKSYLLLRDIFPQNAIDLNMFSKKSPAFWYFIKSKKMYKVSDYIGCMSQANVDFILKHNLEVMADIAEICPNRIETLKIENDVIAEDGEIGRILVEEK
ncbi:hypothetical protein AWH48_07835 [Domibacillus aminovorans]|uniref:Glycosyltransferase subfamily 4-like N-terminal domain-containing protein n=1 Tax=Domibacillus aminovorans TaxID=29332 RepID=A0A177KM66_9BACI|nr:hypothetical protein [Domibacillus aminovorans]OAH54500.1 hypothetical protein AWH48_07835 [Domibacillus aminovorans]